MTIEPGRIYLDQRGKRWKVLSGRTQPVITFLVTWADKRGPQIIVNSDGKDISSARWPIQLVEECE